MIARLVLPNGPLQRHATDTDTRANTNATGFVDATQAEFPAVRGVAGTRLEPLHPEQCRTVACNSGPLPPTFSRPSLLPLKAVIVLPTELSTVESHRLGLLHEATRPRQQLSKKWMVHPLEDPVPCAMKYFAKPCPRSPCPNVGTNTRRRTVKPRI